MISIFNKVFDSKEQPPILVAEISANHNGSLQRALDTIAAASEMGADAVKIQTYTPESLTIDSTKKEFFISSGPWKGRTLYDLYSIGQTPYEWHEAIFEFSKKENIEIFSTPFDEKGVDFLDALAVPAFKVASFEAIDYPLVKYILSKGKPTFISTGMANLSEIEGVVAIAEESDAPVAFLHCVSGYPAPLSESNLKTMLDMGSRFNVPFGLSDHSLGFDVAVTATVLGARIIEKHFTLDRKDGGLDAGFSMEPKEWKELCTRCRSAWSSLGKVTYERQASEEDNAKFRRSLYAVEDIPKGNVFTEKNIRSIRPGYGLPPKEYENVLGKKASCDIETGTGLSWDLVDD